MGACAEAAEAGRATALFLSAEQLPSVPWGLWCCKGAALHSDRHSAFPSELKQPEGENDQNLLNLIEPGKTA